MAMPLCSKNSQACLIDMGDGACVDSALKALSSGELSGVARTGNASPMFASDTVGGDTR
jgi:hypothetical protein